MALTKHMWTEEKLLRKHEFKTRVQNPENLYLIHPVQSLSFCFLPPQCFSGIESGGCSPSKEAQLRGGSPGSSPNLNREVSKPETGSSDSSSHRGVSALL